MVFFNCGQCGESMKKAQVEKHYKFKCRDCQCLSCVDCGKEFWGDEYQKHIKCISEDEKYGGKDYKPKPNANKGEKKQEEWIEQVQNAIDKCKDPKLRSHLEKMKEYSNIPRKKAKFENFLKNSLRIPAYLVTQLWEVISAESLANKVSSGKVTETVNAQQSVEEAERGEEKVCESEEVKKLNKRERKEERQKKKTKKEKKDKSMEEPQERTGENVKEKKKRKRKHAEEDADFMEESENVDPTPKKKRKRRLSVEENGVESDGLGEAQQGRKKHKGGTQSQLPDTLLTETSQIEEDEPKPELVKKTKFNWENVILQVLKQAEGAEVRVKKLKKKVLAEYYSCNPSCHLSEERVLAKLEKKLTKNPRLKVHKDRVKLAS